jgi:hypothetical protein
MADLGAIDKVQAATANVLSKEDAAEVGAMMDDSAHWDQVLLIVHMGGMPPSE